MVFAKYPCGIFARQAGITCYEYALRKKSPKEEKYSRHSGATWRLIHLARMAKTWTSPNAYRDPQMEKMPLFQISIYIIEKIG